MSLPCGHDNRSLCGPRCFSGDYTAPEGPLAPWNKPEAVGSPRDNCVRCHGAKGGVKGNENIVDGEVLCDYCTVEVMDKKRAYEGLIYPSGDVERIRNTITAIRETGFCQRCHASGRLVRGRCIPCLKQEDPR